MNSNNQQSKGCLYTIVTIVLTLLMLLTLAGAFGQTSAEEFYASLNKARKARLLPPLQIDTTLEIASENWIKTIFTKHKGRLVHDYRDKTGEVLYRGYFNPFNSWMHSKPHKKTILRRKYRFVGYSYKDGVACARFR